MEVAPIILWAFPNIKTLSENLEKYQERELMKQNTFDIMYTDEDEQQNELDSVLLNTSCTLLHASIK